MSNSTDPSLHWLHGLNRSSLVAEGRSDLNKQLKSTTGRLPEPDGDGAADGKEHGLSARRRAEIQRLHQKRENHSRELTRLYNNFLRYKVFEIMRQMCRRAESHPFEYAFMMDADTAVNRSNLEAFVTPLRAADAELLAALERRAALLHVSAQ